MRIAFCGKGGSGKSTLSSLFTRYLAAKNLPVLVMDGDINQHLGYALGFTESELANKKAMGASPEILLDYVRGTNVRNANILESTPAGKGSNFICFNSPSPLNDAYIHQKDGMQFIALGGHSLEKAGTDCYHGYTGKMGIFLNHLLDDQGEYFIGDMCAGADPFASCSLATKFDAVFLVVEPTEKSVGVYAQCREYGDPHDVKIFVIGNKVEDADDEDFIRRHVGDAYIGSLTRSSFIRKQEKGQSQSIENLEPENITLLEKVKTITDGLEKNWAHYQKTNAYFLEKAAKGWANAMYSFDFMTQIDPEFSYLQPQKKAA